MIISDISRGDQIGRSSDVIEGQSFVNFANIKVNTTSDSMRGWPRERSELLISRLLRLYLEPRRLEQVKSKFRRRYGERLEEGIAEEVMVSNGASEWGGFCVELARNSVYVAEALGCIYGDSCNKQWQYQSIYPSLTRASTGLVIFSYLFHLLFNRFRDKHHAHPYLTHRS